MILVLFPGKTDKETYAKITGKLEEKKIGYRLRLASAHKSPKLVRKILQDEYELIITGAGLAAALPGVAAAETIVPVIGVACPGAFEALDAFLSIVQMPPGVPVLYTTAENAAIEAEKILSKKEKTAIIGEGKAAERAKAQLDEMGISYEIGDFAKDAVNIAFVGIGEETAQRKELVIYCASGETKASDAEKFMKQASFGLWVGIGRGENAAIAAAQILGKKEALLESRKKFEEKCRKQDEEAND